MIELKDLEVATVGRTCIYPECGADLTLLPDGHKLCTEHQLEAEIFWQDLMEWTEGRGLSAEKFMLALQYKDGMDESAFSILVRRRLSTLKTYRQKKIVQMERVSEEWIVPIQEVIRVLDHQCNWILLYHAPQEYNVSSKTATKAAKRGALGPVRSNLSGQAIIVRQSPDLVRAILEQERAASYRKTKARKYLGTNEYTMPMIASLCGVDDATPHKWRKNGWLVCERRGWWWVTKREELVDFLSRVSRGDFRCWSMDEVRQCQKLYVEFACHGQKLPKSIGQLPLGRADKEFALAHQNGCTAFELACQLEGMLSYDQLKRAIRHKTVAARPEGRGWVITYKEMVRVMDLARNWVTPYDAAQQVVGILRNTIRAYAENDELGEKATYFTGGVAIRRSLLPSLQSRCEQIAKARRANANATRQLRRFRI